MNIKRRDGGNIVKIYIEPLDTVEEIAAYTHYRVDELQRIIENIVNKPKDGDSE